MARPWGASTRTTGRRCAVASVLMEGELVRSASCICLCAGVWACGCVDMWVCVWVCVWVGRWICECGYVDMWVCGYLGVGRLPCSTPLAYIWLFSTFDFFLSRHSYCQLNSMSFLLSLLAGTLLLVARTIWLGCTGTNR